MKAAVRSRYGPPSVLSIADIAKPVPKNTEVLIRVHATTVNRTDCGILAGKPYLIRAFSGLLAPSRRTPGTDFAGVVEAVGNRVTAFRPGDRVWGFEDQGAAASQAEYTVFPEHKGITTIPDGFTFEQAVACAEGAHYAFNFLNKLKLQAGQKVLVNGATGAIGSAAVQLLKHLGLHITAVCAGQHIALVESLGADRVIDYETVDFTGEDVQYHFVFDSVGKSTFGKCKPVLLPGGVYLSSELGPGAENLYLPLLTAIRGGQRVVFPLPSNIPRSLAFIKGLMEAGKFKPVIDRTYPLEDIRDAYAYVASGRKVGNVVVAM